MNRRFSGLAFGVLAGALVVTGATGASAEGDAAAGKPLYEVNCLSGETIRPRPIEDHPLRAEWGWSDRFVVLYAGNIGLGYEFDTMLDAAERLREREEILFALVGGGARQADVEAQVRKRGLANVEFRPYVDRSRLADCLTAGDVHLITLRPGVEGLLVPSKMYGILAAGRPSIYVGPAAGEIPAILQEGACGECLASRDAEALTAAVTGYADDPSRSAEQGRRARALFDRRFARDLALDRFVDLIGRLD